jgi:hypothetical protein
VRNRLCEDESANGKDETAEGDHVAAGSTSGLGNTGAGRGGGAGRSRRSLGSSGASGGDSRVNTWDNGGDWLGHRCNRCSAGGNGSD